MKGRKKMNRIKAQINILYLRDVGEAGEEGESGGLKAVKGLSCGEDGVKVIKNEIK